MLIRALLSLNNKTMQRVLSKSLKKLGYYVLKLQSEDDLWSIISKENSDIIIIDYKHVPKPYINTLQVFKALPDSPLVLLVSEKEFTQEEQAELLVAGCDAVLHPTLPNEQCVEIIETLISKRSEINDQSIPFEPAFLEPRLSDFVSKSTAMQNFMQTVEKVVNSNVSLLILGETGVGKERLAKAVHNASERSNGPFIAINCGALPENLLESELFGHEEGAYTGASRSRRGCFELAHNGTIFLDEIGELPIHLQVKMLRVLQEKNFTRVGGEQPIQVDVRIMAATNRDLELAVNSYQFRRDLFYRLSVVSLTIPPLRERNADIPDLIDSYINYLAPQIGSKTKTISKDALNTMLKYDWPGNIRELFNVIERAILLSSVDEISLFDLPQNIAQNAIIDQNKIYDFTDKYHVSIVKEFDNLSWNKVKREVTNYYEKLYITFQLDKHKGKIGETAKAMNINPRSLYDKMKRLNINKNSFK